MAAICRQQATTAPPSCLYVLHAAKQATIQTVANSHSAASMTTITVMPPLEVAVLLHDAAAQVDAADANMLCFASICRCAASAHSPDLALLVLVMLMRLASLKRTPGARERDAASLKLDTRLVRRLGARQLPTDAVGCSGACPSAGACTSRIQESAHGLPSDAVRCSGELPICGAQPLCMGSSLHHACT